MAEFGDDHIEDWSLQAIVRGSSGDFTKIVDNMDIDQSQGSFFENQQEKFDSEFFASFPDIFDASYGFSDELKEFYKPFYPVERSQLPAKNDFEIKERCEVESVVENEQNHDQIDQLSAAVRAAKEGAAYTPKYKKRKNQHKRVMIQVSAEGLGSDMWAWRKYGQKPIKGSPYPRSYYRCSSTKGCLARKQVEQSCTDPKMFIITYTAEHCHSQPTRRNSLAGTVRQKFPSLKCPNFIPTDLKQENTDESSSNSAAAAVLQPVEVPHFPQAQIKQEIKKEEHDNVSDDLFFNNDNDFFSGLEDFDEFVSEVSVCHTSSSAQQFPVRSCG